MSQHKSLLIIGGGPAGYVAAIRARQLGFATQLVEREHLGGICLNWGCIPTKALLHAAETLAEIRSASELGIHVPEGVTVDLGRMVERSRSVVSRLTQGVRHLMKKNGVEVINGEARLTGPHSVEVSGKEKRTLSADFILIATGARPRPLDQISVDGEHIWNYRHALSPSVLPESLLVVGAGAIGMEFASFYAELGTNVTVLEAAERPLPAEDHEISTWVMEAFKKRGVRFQLGSTVQQAVVQGDAVAVRTKDSQGREQTQTFHRVLVCAGVIGNHENLGLETTRVEMRAGFISIDATGRTAEPSIYAAGDICGAPMLAHKASHEAMRCVEAMAGRDVSAHKAAIPSCIYSRPQVASVGITEREAEKRGLSVRIGRFPFQGNGKALATNQPEGFVKTIFDSSTGELLGAHMAGPNVTEINQTLVLAQNMEAVEEDLIAHMFAHPTLSEAIGESVLDAYGRAIHI